MMNLIISSLHTAVLHTAGTTSPTKPIATVITLGRLLKRDMVKEDALEHHCVKWTGGISHIIT